MNRTHGRSTQDSNTRAGEAVAEAIWTTLGPRGMDRVLVSSSGEVVITSDGAATLEKMDIEHPAARMLAEVSQTQKEETGDGAATMTVLIGELLAHVEDLPDDDLHPTIIVEGYTETARVAQDVVDGMVLDVMLDDDLLRKVAESSMTGKGTNGVAVDVFAKHIVKVVQMVHEDDNSMFHRDDVCVLTRMGASSSATGLVESTALDKKPINENIPWFVSNATIVVPDIKPNIHKNEADAECNIASVDQLIATIDAENNELRSYAKTLTDVGVNVVFCTKSIGGRVTRFLADASILVLKGVKKSDARALTRTTGVKRLGSLSGLDEFNLGRADAVSTRSFDDDDLVFAEDGAATRVVTLSFRGGTEHVIDELERVTEDVVDAVVATIDRGDVIPGVGAAEIAIANRIHSEAISIEGRKQPAIEAYINTIEALPYTLTESTGVDPANALVDLRARYETEDPTGIISSNRSDEISDLVEFDVIDPVAVRRKAIESATEVAMMIVRIDDVIVAK